MLALSDRAHLFVRPSHQEALTRCLATVLGGGAPLRLDAPGLEEPVLAFELPDGGSVSVEFTEDTPDEPDGGRRAWLEVRSDDPSGLRELLIRGVDADEARRLATVEDQAVVHGQLAVTVQPWRIVVDQTAG
jgi:hypothetical protein